jgi:predicted dehydrogenase
VVICTPAPSHVPIALYALENGVHTLIEKPLSHSLANVEELLSASEHSPCQVAVAYVMHVYPVLAQAREFIRSGAIGPVRQATVTAGQPFHKYRPAYAQSYYRDRQTGGGAIQDALTHTANWMESVVGPADSVLCDCAHQVLPGVEVEDTVHLNARHGGTLTSFTLNQFQAPNENTIQFNGDEGSVKIELHRQRWGTFQHGSTEWDWREAAVDGQDVHFLAQANAFLDQIEGRPSRLCSLAAAAQTLRFNLAALASAESGSRVFCRDLQA